MDLLLFGICETVSGVLCSVLSSSVQERQCYTGASRLAVHQKKGRSWSARYKQKTGTESRKIVSLAERRKLMGRGRRELSLAVFDYLTGGCRGDRARRLSEAQWKDEKQQILAGA